MRRVLPLVILSLVVACRGVGDEEPPPVVEDGRVASADGVNIAYTAKGAGAPALVFIHGWSCDRSYWKHQMKRFGGEHRVVAIDLAGHGQSRSDRELWSLKSFGEDVEAVVDELGLDRAIVIGHSMGGVVALEAARRMPDRVIGVIGVDALHDADFEWQPEEWERFLAGWESDFVVTCERYVRELFLESADPDLVSDIQEDMCDASPELAVTLLKLFPDYDMATAMGAIEVPIRSINAASFPTDVQGNRSIADYDAVIMDAVGHFPMLERPDEFNMLLGREIKEIAGRQRQSV